MKTAKLQIEDEQSIYDVVVTFSYYPPEDPGGYGAYRVPCDIEISKITVVGMTNELGSFKRSDLYEPESIEYHLNNIISDNLDKYKEQLIHVSENEADVS
jgi:hypothetical protein